jgi:orotidine-5'-phosphate decarboxylase
MPARDKLIVALDVASAEAGAQRAEDLRGRVGLFKVGAEVIAAEGPLLARYLVSSGHKVFLDLKFHDIPNTVKAAAREAAALGVSMLDVHAAGGRKMMEGALVGARQGSEGAGRPRPIVLAVTVLTSLTGQDLEELGLPTDPEETVVRWARLAQEAGLDGVVASAREINAIRRACGPRFVIVTPGIRLPAAATYDQTRIVTPAAAIQAGADYLVVGRPITQAPDPAAAAQAILTEMEKALASTQVQPS